MKKIYRTYIKFIENFLGYNHYIKMLIAENYALWQKRRLTNSIKWSKIESKEFNNYWKENYKQIRPSGHKLIQALNGINNKSYIPDFLYATKIEAMLNPYLYSKIYSDKSLIEILYKDKSNALIPKTYLLNASSIYYDANRNIIDKKKGKEILLSINTAVIKPIIDGNSGKGVIIGEFDNQGYDKKNDFNILSLLNKKKENFIVQERIKQSKSLSKLYPNSINTFRVITFVSNHKINVAPVSLRMGAKGKNIDNIHAGGLAIGINTETETLLDLGFQLGYSEKLLKHKVHPDTKTRFKGYKINGIKNIINSAIKLHGYTPHIGIISWDITLNQDNIPVLIEANFIGQSMWFSQIVNGKSIFKEETLNILKRIK